MKTVFFKTSNGSVKLNMKEQEKEKEEEEIKRGYFVTVVPGAGGGGTAAGQQEQHGFSALSEAKEVVEKGIQIPDIIIPEGVKEQEQKFKEYTEAKPEELMNIDVKYPLIPANPAQGEPVYAYAHIFWDKKLNELVYYIIEPPIDHRIRSVLEDVKGYIQEKVDIDFAQVKKAEAMDYLTGIFERAMNYIKVSPDIRDVIKYYAFRDFAGLERIEALLRDKRIEDISCDGANIPIYIYHRDQRLGSLKTNITFQDKNELDMFVNKLSERTGKVISVAKPLLDGTLPDGSRVQATLGSDIARQGSNFTIRMFTENPMTPSDVIKFGTADIKMMSYFWFLIENGSSILVSGGTATGKTSLLNVLSMFIKPQMKIVSIEDTAELRLPHPHWVPEVARTVIEEKGAVDMFELLRESLRQRPDYIIVGEVRGKEAYVLFQQMAVGHPGLSTIHAENFPKLMDRLTTPPISLTPTLIQNLDLVVFLKRVKRGNKYLRRIDSVMEVLGYDRKTNTPVVNEIFKWDPKEDKYITVNKSAILKKMANVHGMDENSVKGDLEMRSKVLEWMFQLQVHDYMKVGKVLNAFYTAPEYLMSKVNETLGEAV